MAFVAVASAASAQMPNFFGTPAGGQSSTTSKASASSANSSSGTKSTAAGGSSWDESAHPRDDSGRFVDKNSGGTSSSLTGSGGAAQAQTGGIKQTAGQPASSSIPVYDPSMDNHLKAPEHSERTGLFGLTVKQVEDALRFQGAKNHSYAFGKYSRMTFSAYLITIFFDRDRKVGGFLIEPRAPYKSIEPNAREYFMQTFLKGADLSRFAITVANDKLEVKFVP